MSLNFVCYLSYIIVYNVLLLCVFFSETTQPPTYPDTTNSYPPQPYPLNGGTAPYPTNPATMGIVQPPSYESKAAYDNHGLVK